MNGEFISAQPRDAFSYCADELADFVLIRSEDINLHLRVRSCHWNSYQHGITMPRRTPEVGPSAPSLIQLEYESVLAGSASASHSASRLYRNTGQALYGSDMWTSEAFDLSWPLPIARAFASTLASMAQAFIRFANHFETRIRTSVIRHASHS